MKVLSTAALLRNQVREDDICREEILPLLCISQSDLTVVGGQFFSKTLLEGRQGALPQAKIPLSFEENLQTHSSCLLSQLRQCYLTEKSSSPDMEIRIILTRLITYFLQLEP